MNILSVENISKNFGIKPLFEGASFGLDEADRVGVIGANGSGKTTLLRILSGEEAPDSGRVVVSSGRVIAYLPQVPRLDDDKSVLDAIFEANTEAMRLLHDYEAACRDLAARGSGDERLLRRVTDLTHRIETTGVWDLETNARTVLTRLGITDTEAKIGALSGGQRKRVALAHALIARPDLLILDEPTNHLDADTVAWLEAYLARYKGALLLVTHDRYFLDRVTTRIFEIDRGGIQTFAGSYAYYLERKEEQERERASEDQKRKALIRQELAWLRRGAKARSTKQKARVDRAEELMQRPGEAAKADLDISVASRRMGKKIVELREISKSYGDRVLIEGFSYLLKRGDRVGIIGPNGSGKTTLLDIIAGRVEPDSGTVEIGQTVALGYYDQENRALDDEQRVIDFLREQAEFIRTADGSLITAGQMLERFLFTPEMQYTPIGRLSGGERRRLNLLRALMGAPNVLLLDEATNDLDIQTLVVLEQYLDAFDGCLIIVSHDRYFLDRTVEHVFRFEGNGRVREYPGNYSAFLEIREREAAESEALSAKVAPARSREVRASSGPRKLSFKEKRELQELESRIEAAEKRKIEIEARMAANASDSGLIEALFGEQQELDRQLDRDLERWAELAAMAE
ncbi:MAG TPA: ABC-F family ATP-binding cassette domain-containing protein [Blastocatellia bacterium]|jgi:ATP-binding cassette subfamily F protein uup|nr:ABC-F family ATP-binding cassette domain-containing protein [Blastocatellia bacterium]